MFLDSKKLHLPKQEAVSLKNEMPGDPECAIDSDNCYLDAENLF